MWWEGGTSQLLATCSVGRVSGAALTHLPGSGLLGDYSSPATHTGSFSLSVYPLPVRSHRDPGSHHGHSLGVQELRGGHHSEVGHVHEDVAACHQ